MWLIITTARTSGFELSKPEMFSQLKKFSAMPEIFDGPSTVPDGPSLIGYGPIQFPKRSGGGLATGLPPHKKLYE